MPFSARQGLFGQRAAEPEALWTPDNLPGIQAWYDSTDSSNITLNGSNVSTWTDQRGNYNWTQSTAGSQPLLDSGLSELSSSNVLKFSDDFMTANSMGTIFSNQQPGVMFMVLYQRDTGTAFHNHLTFGDNTSGVDYMVLQRQNSSGGRRPMFARDEGPKSSIQDLDAKNNEWGLFLGYSNGSSSRFRTNGGSGAGGRDGVDNTGTLPLGPVTFGYVTLGGFTTATVSPTGFSNMDVAAVVVSNSTLSDADMEKLEGWAAHKYGLTVVLPTAHPYKTAAPIKPDIDADVTAWAANVAVADGQALESGVIDAVDTFVKGVKADGDWTNIEQLLMLSCARTVAGAAIPLKGNSPTFNNVTSGDYNRTTGILGDPSSTLYIDSNYAMNVLGSAGNTYIGAYQTAARTDVAGDTNNQALFAKFETGANSNSLGMLVNLGSGGAADGYALSYYLSSGADVHNGGVGTSVIDYDNVPALYAIHTNSSTSYTASGGTQNSTITKSQGVPGTTNLNYFRRRSSGDYHSGRLSYGVAGGYINHSNFKSRMDTLYSDIVALGL